jgi:TP901 family phage tail tape measure protein
MLGLGQYSSLGVGLAVTLIDNFSGNANRINQSMNQMANNAQASQRAAAKAMQQSGAIMMGTSAMMAIPMAKAVDVASKFEYVMSGVKAATEATGNEFKALEKKAIDLGNASIFSAKEVADAMYELSTAGYNAKETYEAINGIVSLGATADVPLEQAALLAANIRNAFQIPAAQTDRIADLLSMASIKSSAKLPEMAEGMKYVSARASMLKVPLEETIALIATLNSMGLHGSTAGTAADNLLRTMATAMSDFKTKKQSAVLDMIGLGKSDIVDAQGNLIALDKMIEKVFSKIKNYSPMDQSAIISALINERGARAQILAAISGKKGEGISFADLSNILKYGADGAASNIAKTRQDNLYGDIEKLKSAWESFMIAMGKAIGTVVRLAVALTKVLDIMVKLVSTPIGKFLAVMLAGWVAVNFAIGAYRFTMGSLVLLTNSGIIANSRWATSAVAGYGAATTAARTYGVTMATVNRLGLGSMMAGMAGVGWNAGAGRFVGAGGRFMGMAAVASRFGILGQILLMVIGLFQGLATAIMGIISAIGAGITGILTLLGPIGWVIAALGVVAGGLYMWGKHKEEKEKRENDPAWKYKTRVQNYKLNPDNQYTYDPKTGRSRRKTEAEIAADIQGIANDSYGTNLTKHKIVSPLTGKEVEVNSGQTIIINVDGQRTVEKQIEKDISEITLNTNAYKH